MRLVALVFALLLCASRSEAQFNIQGWGFLSPSSAAAPFSGTVVQVAHGGITHSGTGTSSGTAVFGSNVTSGNVIVTGFTFRDGQPSAFTGYTIGVSDTRSTSYSAQGSCNTYVGGGTARQFMIYHYSGTLGSSGANTVTVNVSGGANIVGGAVFAFELSGISPTTGLTSPTCNNVTNNVPALGNTGGQFLMGIFNSNEGSSCTITPTNPSYSVVQDDSTNDEFDAMYFVGTTINNANFAITTTCAVMFGVLRSGSNFP